VEEEEETAAGTTERGGGCGVAEMVCKMAARSSGGLGLWMGVGCGLLRAPRPSAAAPPAALPSLQTN